MTARGPAAALVPGPGRAVLRRRRGDSPRPGHCGGGDCGQAIYFHRALIQHGVDHELVIYPRENHSFTERHHQIDVVERVRSWFMHWLSDPVKG